MSFRRSFICKILFWRHHASRCHPREGGDPVFELVRNLLFWIPAFAGMTARGAIH